MNVLHGQNEIAGQDALNQDLKRLAAVIELLPAGDSIQRMTSKYLMGTDAEGQDWIICLSCCARSGNQNYVVAHYCANCHAFLDDAYNRAILGGSVPKWELELRTIHALGTRLRRDFAALCRRRMSGLRQLRTPPGNFHARKI